MDIYLILKNNYSNLQSDYCKMIKNIKNNNMNYENIKDEFVDLCNIMDDLSRKLEDINMLILSNNPNKNKKDIELLNNYEEDKKILNTLMPYYMLLKYHSLNNK